MLLLRLSSNPAVRACVPLSYPPQRALFANKRVIKTLGHACLLLIPRELKPKIVPVQYLSIYFTVRNLHTASNPIKQVLHRFLKMTIQNGVYVLETKLILSYDDINQAKMWITATSLSTEQIQPSNVWFSTINLFSTQRTSCKRFKAQILAWYFTSILRMWAQHVAGGSNLKKEENPKEMQTYQHSHSTHPKVCPGRACTPYSRNSSLPQGGTDTAPENNRNSLHCSNPRCKTLTEQNNSSSSCNSSYDIKKSLVHSYSK